MSKYIILPLISALIGYLTNVVAIKMLFWPRMPINLLFFSLQGLLPKRKMQLASSLGDLVEEQLLSLDDLFEKIDTPEVRKIVSQQIVMAVRDRLGDIIPTIIPVKITKVVADGVERLILQEIDNIFNRIMESGQEYLKNEIKISRIVENKVNAFNLDQLEKLIRSVSSPELRAIEILGGVLGLIIGIIQDGILWLLS
ncbi:MAG: DUF445 domain-containing protein [Syntrophomonadaceae bacterium]